MDRYENIQQIAQNAGCAVKRQENLSRYTSFHIGGPADLWIETPSVRALSQLLSLCWEENLPWMVLGKGSNLLVPDEGVHGVVLHLCGDFETIHVEEPGLIRCGAAVSLMKLCKFAQEQGLSGLEFAWGIPGSVGGGGLYERRRLSGGNEGCPGFLPPSDPTGKTGGTQRGTTMPVLPPQRLYRHKRCHQQCLREASKRRS